jgi:hypothetical protein
MFTTFGRSTITSDVQEVNAYSPIIVAFGKFIFINEQQSKNAFEPIRATPDSSIVWSTVHPLKLLFPTIFRE